MQHHSLFRTSDTPTGGSSRSYCVRKVVVGELQQRVDALIDGGEDVRLPRRRQRTVERGVQAIFKQIFKGGQTCLHDKSNGTDHYNLLCSVCILPQ